MSLLRKSLAIIFLIIFSFLTTSSASAHEAYVLTKEQFAEGMQTPGFHSLSALQNPSNLQLFIQLSLGITILLLISFLLRHSKIGLRLDTFLKQFTPFSSVIVRLSIAVTFFAAAVDNRFLGPEISLANFPLSAVCQLSLFVISVMIFCGFLTKVASIIGLVIFGLTVYLFGWYPLNYIHYLGVLIVLVLFGSRMFSLDRKLFGPLKRFSSFQKYEPTIIRVFYGLALLYAAITIKVLHSNITQTVVNQYHLTQFTWLFPSDPVMVTLGAALAEVTIGLFILIGFQLRLTILISLFYITLSLLYFQESVWPHLMMYGISLSLLINGGGPLTIDGFFDKLFKKRHWLKN